MLLMYLFINLQIQIVKLRLFNIEQAKLQKMRIRDQCPTDNDIISPQILLTDIYSFTDLPIRDSFRGETKKLSEANDYTTSIKQNSNKQGSSSVKKRTKKKQQQGLKRLIREHKVKAIVHRFIQKLKINNVNSSPVLFQPYEVEERQSLYNARGIELPDIFQKILSIFIAIQIMICLFIDTTSALYPQILGYPIVKVGQFTAFFVFIVQFVSSCIVVKMIEGKKIDKVSQIIQNYFSDGLLIDFAYLIILIVSFFTFVGNFRLIILLKLPQCLERVQRIQNTYINTFYKEQYWGLAKVFLLNFILAHFLALGLLMMAELQPSDNWLVKFGISRAIWYQQYVWAYYWGTTIMLTVGFGDITPANFQQAICVVLIETFSCLCLAYNINCVGNLISNLKSQDNQKNKNIKTFKILTSRNDITQDLELKIHNYIEESTNIKKKFNFEEQSKFISALPSELKADFLKESNKKIFQNLIFFKNLTQKTLLNFAQVIHMKICHPQQVVKRRGELSGLMILKQGKIALCTKLMGSDFSNVSIEKVKVEEGEDPFLLSLDFISQQRVNYEVKSQEYAILYFLNLEKTLQTLKTGELDYEHFCFLRDRSGNYSKQYQVFNCKNCDAYHTKFDCPKLHYCPLKKHVIDKYLHNVKISRSNRYKPYLREKVRFYPFKQLQNNLSIVKINQFVNNKFTSWKKRPKQIMDTISNIKFYGISLKKDDQQHSNINGSIFSLNFLQNLKQATMPERKERDFENAIKSVQNEFLIQALKDQINQAIARNEGVWLIECDQIKNFKFYFSSFNSSSLSYLNKKSIQISLFN